ncbi:MAG: hypothetical protein WC872_04835, partial [Candidatus Absconditabacterales bacterium]
MKEAYLRGYYGYKNFGDEILFFGLVKFIFSNYDVSKLYVEVGNKNWMEHWIEKNSQILNFSKYLNKLQDRK